MNKFFGLFGLGLIGIIALSSFNVQEPTEVSTTGDAFEIPDNIQAIFKENCFGCHNSESKNMKGKEKLKIDKLTTMKKSKLAAALGKISEVIKEGEMPPEKFLAKYPDKDISPENAKILMEWADKAAEEL